MAFGGAVDDGVSFNLAQKIETHEDLPTKEVIEVAVTGMEIRRETTEWDEPYADVKDQVPGVVRAFQGQCAKTIQPVAVQEKITIDLEGEQWGIRGYIDVREENAVVDVKTAKRSWSAGRELTEMQPLAYTCGEPGDSKFRFDIAVRTKTPKVQRVERLVSQDEKVSFLNYVALMKGRMDEVKSDPDKALPTGHAGMLCSKRYCGYWEMCHARHGLHIRD